MLQGPRGELSRSRRNSEAFGERTWNEAKCLCYGFSFVGDTAYCREAHTDAAVGWASIS